MDLKVIIFKNPFINLFALKGGTISCRQRSFCEGVRAASRLGPGSRVMAELASEAAPHWLPGLSPRQRRQVARAGLRGLRDTDCELLYPCHKLLSH